MREFVIEMNMIGITENDVNSLMKTYGLIQVVSARGRWLPTDCGEITGPDDEIYPVCKFVTPLISLKELYDLKWILDRFFNAGAMASMDNPLKIHFLRRYSDRFAKKITKMLVVENKLLFTLLLYPCYSGLLSPDFKFSKINNKNMLNRYHVFINTASNREEVRAVEETVYNILIPRIKPHYSI